MLKALGVFSWLCSYDSEEHRGVEGTRQQDRIRFVSSTNTPNLSSLLHLHSGSPHLDLSILLANISPPCRLGNYACCTAWKERGPEKCLPKTSLFNWFGPSTQYVKTNSPVRRGTKVKTWLMTLCVFFSPFTKKQAAWPGMSLSAVLPIHPYRGHRREPSFCYYS